MEAFKKSLKDRRETVLSGLRHKMDVLRTENQFMKDLLDMHNIECPPLSEITVPRDVPDNIETCSDEEEEVPEVQLVVEPKPCEKCESLESEIVGIKRELSRTQSDLQEVNSQYLEQTTELQKVRNHCQALKDVNRIIKELIGIRDQELTQLKEKLKEIEQTMSERETEMLSEHLRTEYTRQLENIRRLKTLYEQRARSADAEIEILKRKLADKATEVDNELLKNEEKEQRITMNDTEIARLNAELLTTRDAVKDTKNEMGLVQNDLQAINMLFTRILTNKDNFDLDRLKNVLEENRMLLTEVTTRSNDCSIIADSVLPKLLCDLIVGAFAEPEIQLDSASTPNSSDEELNSEDATPLIVQKPDLLATDEIIENLPKIWRILTELLIHQKTTQFNIDATGKSEDCYKTVETPSGPQLVLSVSKTFIKLKDLILEKKGLQKETKRLKVLNEHLQQTLNCQEDRLGAVSVEVTKTWHLVNRMQRQHRQLHTKEQVLRYHLQQKRRMLSVLKEELETCRHKWTQAREKNESSEIQWKLLRDEFTSRKGKSQSVESGYSDDQVTDEDADVEDNAAGGGSTAAAAGGPLQIELVDPIDETLEQMFYRLNAIHTVNSLNFEPVLEEPPIYATTAAPPHDQSLLPNTATTTTTTTTEREQEQAFENNRSMEVLAESPPHLIDDQLMIEGAENESPLNSETEAPEPSTSSNGLTTAEEEYTARRNERIKRLEEQCKALFDKMTSNKKKGDDLSEQLDNSINSRQVERGINSIMESNGGEGTSGVQLQGEVLEEETITEVEVIPGEDLKEEEEIKEKSPEVQIQGDNSPQEQQSGGEGRTSDGQSTAHGDGQDPDSPEMSDLN